MTTTLNIPDTSTQFQYHFDGYLDGAACGWIFFKAQPNQPVALGVYSDDELIASGSANIGREDLVAHKVGNGSCAFRIPLTPEAEQSPLEVRVLHTDHVLEGSKYSPQEWDHCVTQLTNSFRFEKYHQFKEVNLRKQPRKAFNFKPSYRLSKSFSKRSLSPTSLPSILEWSFGMERQGGAGFFDNQSHHAMDNIAWYLFDYQSPVKKHLPTAALSPIFAPAFPTVPGMSHYSMAYSLWLHRNAIKLNNIELDSKENFFGFISTLLAANVPLEKSTLPAWLTSNVNKFSLLNGIRLPRMSKYGETKHKRSYTSHYEIEKPTHYLAYLFDVALHAQEDEAHLMGEEVISFLKHSIDVNNGSVSRFALLIWIYYTKAQIKPGESRPIDDAEVINRWFKSKWLPLYPAHNLYFDEFSENESNENTVQRGKCYVVSHWDYESGLTKNAHMSVKALNMAGIPMHKVLPDGTILDVIGHTIQTAIPPLVRDIVILHVNADKAPEALAALSKHVDLDRAYVIGFYLWELETIPECHLLGLELVDEIWVPTSFVKQIYSPYAPEKIRYVGKAISVPKFDNLNPKKFGISEECTSFLITYDINSGLERKNPLAAVRAFQMAFQGAENVQLIIKTTPYKAGHWGDPFNQWGQILKAISCDERIVVIDSYITDEEMFELVATVDVVVSTHRAEGFGYLPAYGLFYDKTVIATGYSGVSDFAPLSNIIMAEYSLVDVPCGKFVYPVPGAQWAEVNIKKLSQIMADCHNNERDAVAKEVTNNPFREFYCYEQLSQRYINALREANLLA